MELGGRKGFRNLISSWSCRYQAGALTHHRLCARLLGADVVKRLLLDRVDGGLCCIGWHLEN